MSEFLPLAEAASQAYAALVGEDPSGVDQTRREAHLSYLAGELASILPVFTAVDGAAPSILPPERVVHGVFTKGGQLLTMKGSALPVGGLCVRRGDLRAAIEQLRSRIGRPSA
jgi:hypothetical protein